MQQWREIKGKGYPGTHRQVSKWMSKRRQKEQATESNVERDTFEHISSPIVPLPATIDALPSARQLAWLMMHTPEQLKQEEVAILLCIQQNMQVKQVYQLSQQFIQLIQKRKTEQLDQWLSNCKTSGIAMLQSFAARLEKDYAAVRAALETEWSNGQTEGQINQLKLLKRQMYGRANFDLLRKRFLYAA